MSRRTRTGPRKWGDKLSGGLVGAEGDLVRQLGRSLGVLRLLGDDGDAALLSWEDTDSLYLSHQ